MSKDLAILIMLYCIGEHLIIENPEETEEEDLDVPSLTDLGLDLLKNIVSILLMLLYPVLVLIWNTFKNLDLNVKSKKTDFIATKTSDG